MRPLTSARSDPPKQEVTEWEVNLSDRPYLGEHGFQGLVVLPGSACIELALAGYAQRFGRLARAIRHVHFERPLISSEHDRWVWVDSREIAPETFEYTFCAAASESNAIPARGEAFARMLLEDGSSAARFPSRGEQWMENFKRQAVRLLASDVFYERLRRNGNQYGPTFQRLSSVYLSPSEALAQVTLPSEEQHRRAHHLHTAVLDSLVQALAALILDCELTFILLDIGRIDLVEGRVPENLWAHARLNSTTPPSPEGTVVGNVSLLDGQGNVYLELSAVTLKLLPAPKEPAQPLRITSTFTAEPVQDSLEFWADYFETPLRIEFLPYNQVFQPLLDRGSAFHQNRTGVNVILVGLEDWLDAPVREHLRTSERQAEVEFKDLPRCLLPNGMEVADLNRYETDYLYQEIFENRTYLRHGIRLVPGATVIDAGANIGMFSLFVLAHCDSPKIYAFEPSPAAFEVLRANCAIHGAGAVHVANCGLSDREKTASFTFYKNSSVFSGFHADPAKDRQAIRAVVSNLVHHEAPANGATLDTYIDELTHQKMVHETRQGRLTSLSRIIQEHGIGRIDLLKIDAEKSELEILDGIEESDWARIDQIVLEVHDETGTAVLEVEKRLRERGYKCGVDHEKLLDGSGLANFYATRLDASEPPPSAQANLFGTKIDEFCSALRAFAQRSTVPLILAVAPRTRQSGHCARVNTLLDEGEALLLRRVADLPTVQTVPSNSIADRRLVREYHDPHAHEIGHVPYSPQGFSAIGTSIFRKLFQTITPPFKVLVLDCDDTLWKGNCAEDGPGGLEFSTPYQALQRWALRQVEGGFVICLCSKNDEQDVWAVFEERQDLLLRRDQIAAWRVNWERKSDNLKALAAELNLGLDAFVMIENNPVECAEIRANCPEVLVLQLPADPARIPAFLERQWFFEQGIRSREDSHRNQWYRQNAEREKLRGQGPSLRAFLETLELRVEIVEATDAQVARVSQLTVRTNQFNLTGIRRSEAEIQQWRKQPGARCLVTSAADRFGDYGIVGAVLCRSEESQCVVDTFLLSCRALGKGIEHRMLAEVGRIAREHGEKTVLVPFTPAQRNRPALDFLISVPKGRAEEANSGLTFEFAAEDIAAWHYDPDAVAATGNRLKAPAPPLENEGGMPRSRRTRQLSAKMQEIAEHLYAADRVTAAVEARRAAKAPPCSTVLAEPLGNSVEAVLADIWRRVLGVPRINRSDNFFELGGTSLKAVLVLAEIKRELKQSVSIVTFFECPTVKLLAARLKVPPGNGERRLAKGGAAERGRQRRYGLIKK